MGARPPRDSRRSDITGAATGGRLRQAGPSIAAPIGPRAVARPRLGAALTSRAVGRPFQADPSALDPVVRKCHGPVTDLSASDVIFTTVVFAAGTDMNSSIKITITPLSVI